jgi:hypothetical protein
MTLRRALAWYLGLGALLALILGAIDGFRGLAGAGAAWLVCLPPLILPLRAWRVAASRYDPKIGGGWIRLRVGDILLRIAWTLGAGAGLYLRFGADLGVGFWVALLIDYQVTLALRTAGVLNISIADPGDRATDAPG